MLKADAADGRDRLGAQDLFGQLPLRITALLGSTQLSLAQLGGLGAGTVVELDELNGEPLLLLANGMPFAHGEAVVVNDRMGIRVTSILTGVNPPHAPTSR